MENMVDIVALPGLILMIAGVGIVIVVGLMLRNIFRQEQSGPFSGNRNLPGGYPQPQVGEDGFWLDTSNIPPGSTVRYRYHVERPGIQQYGCDPGGNAAIRLYGRSAREYHDFGDHVIGRKRSAFGDPRADPYRTCRTRKFRRPGRPAAPSKFAGFPAAY